MIIMMILFIVMTMIMIMLTGQMACSSPATVNPASVIAVRNLAGVEVVICILFNVVVFVVVVFGILFIVIIVITIRVRIVINETMISSCSVHLRVVDNLK